MDKVEAYRASDGALFPTAEQCQAHEVSLTWRARIDEFMASKLCPYHAGTPAKISVNIIVAWEQFKETHKGVSGVAIDVDEGPEIDVPVKRKLSASKPHRPGKPRAPRA